MYLGATLDLDGQGTGQQVMLAEGKENAYASVGLPFNRDLRKK
jgi:hypothetical protein